MNIEAALKDEIMQKFGDFLMPLIMRSAQLGASIAIKQFQEQHLLPSVQEAEKTYELKEVLALHFKDKRFKKVSQNTLLNWEKEDRIKNYGSPRHKKYREMELLAAMKDKGKKKLI